MALLFPDFGSWLFRSPRRDTFAEKSPILTVERLILASRPIGDADKDALVGAVLTMGSSLHQALGLILELLPEDKAGERLGEILCPTLGQLLASLQSTLSAFECPPSNKSSTSVRPLRRLKHSRSESALRHRHSGGLIRGPPLPAARPLTPILVKKRTPPQTPGSQHGEKTPVAASPARFHSSPNKPSYHSHRRKDTEIFPPLQDDIPTPRGQPSSPDSERRDSETGDLVKALQSELRVQSAIKVAVESLEFAERQLQLVKEINRLHGGSFEIMQKQFYSGYNTLLMRALELERNELQQPEPTVPTRQLLPAPSAMSNGQRQRPATSQGHHRQQPSIHVSFSSTMPTPSASPRTPLRAQANGNNSETDGEQPRITRRNTIQGIQEKSDQNFIKPALKRRLSLAEELALAGDDDTTEDENATEDDRSSDSGVSDEHSETESTVYNTGIETSERSETDDSQSESQIDDSDDESDRNDDVDDDEDEGVLSSNSSNEIYGHGMDDGSKLPRVEVKPLQ